MSAIVESQFAPSINSICTAEAESVVRHQRVGEVIKTIVVTGGSVNNVPWGGRVVELVGIRDAF